MFALFNRLFGKKEEPEKADNRVEAYFQRSRNRANLSTLARKERENNFIREKLIEREFDLTEQDPWWVWAITVFFNILLTIPELLASVLTVSVALGQILYGLVVIIIIVVITEGIVQWIFTRRAAGWGVGAWGLFFAYHIISGILGERNAEKRRKKQEEEDAKEALRNRDQDLADETFLKARLESQVATAEQTAFRKMGQLAEESLRDSPEQAKPLLLLSGIIYPPSHIHDTKPEHIYARFGTDHVPRYSCYNISVLILQDTYMVLYQCEYDSIDDRVVKDVTTEFQYEDIVSITVADRTYSAKVPINQGEKSDDKDKKPVVTVEVEATTTELLLKTNAAVERLGFTSNIGAIVGYSDDTGNLDMGNRLLNTASTDDIIKALRARVREKVGM